MKPWKLYFLLLFYSHTTLADKQQDACLLAHLQTAKDNVTIGELKARCETDSKLPTLTKQTSALSTRIQLERQQSNPFSLLPHKPNYIILSNNFSKTNEKPFRDNDPGESFHFQPWETKFQLSLKVPVVRDLFNSADLYVAYTNRSFFQQFNKEKSAPFRETNHEPEAWLSFRSNLELFGFHNRVIRTGISHQSNGRSGNLSRSWNRVYADFLIEHGDWYFSLKPWWRIPESNDSDDNPNIDDFMGNFELGGLYKHEQHNFSFLLRNNLKFGDNHGAIELGWTFPINDDVKGYVQWFNGYGESLIDYNAHSNSLGFGIQLSDWL